MVATVSTSGQRSGASRMGPRIAYPARPHHLAQRGSLDLRLAERWGCQVTTARARREQAIKNAADVLEELLRMGDRERLGQIFDLFDAVVAGYPDSPKIDPLYDACRADIEEDMAELEFRRQPSRDTARGWYERLGREGRQNTPAMAQLRRDWNL